MLPPQAEFNPREEAGGGGGGGGGSADDDRDEKGDGVAFRLALACGGGTAASPRAWTESQKASTKEDQRCFLGVGDAGRGRRKKRLRRKHGCKQKVVDRVRWGSKKNNLYLRKLPPAVLGLARADQGREPAPERVHGESVVAREKR